MADERPISPSRRRSLQTGLTLEESMNQSPQQANARSFLETLVQGPEIPNAESRKIPYMRFFTTSINEATLFDSNTWTFIATSGLVQPNLSPIIQFINKHNIKTPWLAVFNSLVEFNKTICTVRDALRALPPPPPGTIDFGKVFLGHRAYDPFSKLFVDWIQKLAAAAK